MKIESMKSTSYEVLNDVVMLVVETESREDFLSKIEDMNSISVYTDNLARQYLVERLEGYCYIHSFKVLENGFCKVVLGKNNISLPEQREQIYAEDKLIEWEDTLITIDKANELFNAYLAEGNTLKTSQLSELISIAKSVIREQYSN